MIDEYVVDYDEYLGLGSGSFGYLNGEVLANTFSISDYVEALENGFLPLFGRKHFSERDRMGYDFMMKLFGGSIDLTMADDKYQGTFSKTMFTAIAGLKLLGALTQNGSVLQLTDKGRYYWVIMMREFFTGVNNFRDICLGRAQIDIYVKAKSLGLLDYLAKPFKVDDLEKLIGAALEEPEIKKGGKEHLWLELGAVSYRLCDHEYECGSCAFAQDIQDRFGTIAVIGDEEVAQLKQLPGSQRLCRYASVHFVKKEELPLA